ncbi:MAG: dihydropteroate synthase [Deltaproteobacteria bacterium]|nr:dihydropteroate synthase [Deltaproteobacteria bacterium]
MKREGFCLSWGKHALELGRKSLIMGVLNITPDSFSDGGHYFSREQAIKQALDLVADGADIIDIGGESTRPYAEKVSLQQEMERVIPVIEELSRIVNIPISIDTYKAKVAESAVKAGASIINDISALKFDPEMASVVKEAGVPVILMHMKGTPGNMQDNPVYNDLMGEIISFFNEAVDYAVKKGIRKEMIILDPGIGFGKNFNHNLMIIRDFRKLADLGLPLLLGSSRKAFIGKILDKTPEERDTGTMATVVAGILNGAHIVRVHNVRMAKETVKIVDAILAGKAIPA